MARRYRRDSRGRFARTTSGSRTRRNSTTGNVAVSAAVALGTLYAVNGKGPYRVAGAALVSAAGLYSASRARR